MTDKRMTKTDFLEAVTDAVVDSGMPLKSYQIRAVINIALALLQQQMELGGSVGAERVRNIRHKLEEGPPRP